jgi:hypothetical protein
MPTEQVVDYSIQNDDRDSLERLTGGAVNEEILAEAHLWTRLYHADGHSGPLGTVALLSMLRILGVSLRPTAAPTEAFDWNAIRADGSVIVEARVPDTDDVVIGRFVGFVAMGSLAVQVGNQVIEFPPIHVRLKGQSEDGFTDTLSVTIPVEEGPFIPAPETEVDPPLPEAFPMDDRSMWLTIAAGRGVWVMDQDDTKDGEFMGMADDGLKVLVAGEDEPRVFRVPAVMLAD